VSSIEETLAIWIDALPAFVIDTEVPPRIIMNAKNPTQEVNNVRRGKMLAWSIFQVVVPFAFVVIAWPMGMADHVNYAFEKSFVGGDLLLLGAMLFIAIVVEIHIEQKRLPGLNNKASLDWYWYGTLGLAVLFLAIFTFIKSRAIGIDFPVRNPTPPPPMFPDLDENIQWYVYGSIAGGAVAFVWSLAAGTHTNLMYREAEIAELEEVVTASERARKASRAR